MQEEQKKTLMFLVKFGVIFSVLHFLVWTVPTEFLQKWIAGIQAGFFGLTIQNNLLFIEAQKILINPSCTGLISISILAAIIFSLRKPEIKQKIQIFIGASIVMFLLNLLRIYFVLWIGLEFGIQWIDLVHEISWMTTAVFIIGLWYYFTKKITKVKEFNELL
ncbi:archaeosortase/exosortase family protein [Candidatus Micrarchaeota archaeon]|nr:archaeosortase/exosortase family protein [Candidatus Micrarchaeota archaeon]